VVPPLADANVMVVVQLDPEHEGAVSETKSTAFASVGSPTSVFEFENVAESEHPAVTPVPIVVLGWTCIWKPDCVVVQPLSQLSW
jgi:hypothetical protein